MSMENSQQQPPPPTIQTPGVSAASPLPPMPYSSSHAAPFQHLLQTQQHHQLQMFWNYQRQEIEHANDFKNHQLPLARIKKIMKADEDVRMISAEAPVLFAKACELFILELTIRSWLHAEENKRRTLQKSDIAAAITRTDIFDFLVDIVPRDAVDAKVGADDASSAPVSGPATGVAAAAGVPYYYPPMGQPAGVMPGVDPSTAYGQPSWQPMWQPGAADAGQGPYGGPNLDGQGYAGGHPTQQDGS